MDSATKSAKGVLNARRAYARAQDQGPLNCVGPFALIYSATPNTAELVSPHALPDRIVSMEHAFAVKEGLFVGTLVFSS